MKIKGEIRAAASVDEIVLQDGQPPEWVQLLKMGANERRDGVQPPYLVADRAHAEQIVAASAAYHRSTDPMFDYDHQSVYGAKDGVGGTAKASGWIKKLEARDDGIWGRVEWTAAASAAIAAKEYRYTSPYFGHSRDGRVTRIFNAALTNRPELELQAVASQSDPDVMENGDFMKSIATALGLAEGATEQDILAAVTTLVGTSTAVCSALGLQAGAAKEVIAVKIGEIKTAASQGGKVDPTKFVPMSEFTALKSRVDATDEERVAASVAEATKRGKITPAPESQAWATDLATNHPESWKKFLGAAPEIVGEGTELSAEQLRAAAQSDKLSAEEKAVCAQMGLSEADYLKSRKEMSQ